MREEELRSRLQALAAAELTGFAATHASEPHSLISLAPTPHQAR
jgi:hypothetical protein